MSDAKQPDWKLTEDWGINRDPLNWMLVYRPKTSKSDGRWRVKGYFPNITMLLEFWHRQFLRDAPPQGDLVEHFSKCANDVAYAIERLAAAVEQRMERVEETDDILKTRRNMLALNRNFVRFCNATFLELEQVNVGQEPNDGTGDTLYEAWKKVNRNFGKIKCFLRDARDGEIDK